MNNSSCPIVKFGIPASGIKSVKVSKGTNLYVDCYGKAHLYFVNVKVYSGIIRAECNPDARIYENQCILKINKSEISNILFNWVGKSSIRNTIPRNLSVVNKVGSFCGSPEELTGFTLKRKVLYEYNKDNLEYLDSEDDEGYTLTEYGISNIDLVRPVVVYRTYEKIEDKYSYTYKNESINTQTGISIVEEGIVRYDDTEISNIALLIQTLSRI